MAPWAVTLSLLIAILSGPAAFAQTPSANELVEWLGNRETEWLATAQLQAVPEAALPLLLQPGRVATGPHGDWSAQMIALAKLGTPAIPAITDRVIVVIKTGEANTFAATHPLIKVLGSMGSPAVPALLQIAEAGTNQAGTLQFPALDALDEIVGVEPRTSTYGQLVSAWGFWRPADARLDELRREIVPQLPRLQKLMERAITAWKPENPAPQRPAAYLLARWGEGEVRARGLQVLEDLARGNEPFYRGIESIRLLHALRAPQTAALIRIVAAKVPDAINLKGQYFLSMATALHQLGDRDYVPLVSVALSDPQSYTRIEAAQFIASSGEISYGRLLVPLLEDLTPWNGRTVAQVVQESLRRLTLEEFAATPETWRTWFETNGAVPRSTLVARRLKIRLAAIRQAPIWEANRWMSEFEASDGAALLPLIDQYLARRDLQANASGPNQLRGGSGPIGINQRSGPRVVTLLLDMTMRGVPGALQRLNSCLDTADPDVRMVGSLALAAFDRQRAIDRLAIEAQAPERWHRQRASEFLLQLGDKRGIPSLLETLTSDQPAARMFACRDLRVYTQEPLPCDVQAIIQPVWNEWWKRAEPTFQVRTREAELDLAAFPRFSPVSIGDRPVR